ncbi:hypothetical protein [Nonomuraea antimicrobica]
MHFPLSAPIAVRTLRNVPPLDLALGIAPALPLTFGTLTNRYFDDPLLDVGLMAVVLLATLPHALRRLRPWASVLLTMSGVAALTAFGAMMTYDRGFGHVVPVVFCSVALALYTLLRLVDRQIAWIIVGAVAAVAAMAHRPLLAAAGLDVPAFENLVVMGAGPAVVVGVGLAAEIVRGRTELRMPTAWRPCA